jgi:protoporphyrinogen oxidase
MGLNESAKRSVQTSNKENDTTKNRFVVVAGAGPAGLTAAYEMTRLAIPGVVIEKDDVVGGIARTVNVDGWRFDIGGHRFFTKVEEVERLWHEMMGEDFLVRPRLSRIYYKRKFYYYPLRAANALRNLGIVEAVLCVLSYFKARLFPRPNEESFEDYIVNKFGERLYRHFFKTYTEKVWGVPCTEIRAEWAAQRIKGLSLTSAIINAVFKPKKQGIKTLIERFEYPRLGPGMMWERFKEYVEERGIEVRMSTEVTKILREDSRIVGVEVRPRGGDPYLIEATDVISSMPIRELISKIDPPPPSEVLEAARGLKYRDFITVALVIDQEHLFDDNWIYIHSPDVRLGRIQNFKNWSPEMVPDRSKTCLGLEYFAFEGDDLWTSSDDALIKLGEEELVKLGLVEPGKVERGWVVRMPKAYPMYDSEYRERMEVIRAFLDSLEGLHPVGRNGMHKYNNQDHSMVTAMLAVRNIAGANYDVWAVNVDEEYHEEGKTVSLQEAGTADKS